MASQPSFGRDHVVSVAGFTDAGIERLHNEDAFLIARAKSGELVSSGCEVDLAVDPIVLAVADGMGGENAGEVASALTIQSLRNSLAAEFLSSDPGGSLRSSVEQAHRVVLSESTGTKAGMGSTLVAALLQGRRACIASVGDSRAYLLREGALRTITKDQSLLQEMIDRGRLETEAEIAAYPMRHVVLQAIGRATQALNVQMHDVELRSVDVLLLCSDGLTNELPDAAIADLLLRASSPDVMCTTLIEAACASGGHDNISVVVASVH